MAIQRIQAGSRVAYTAAFVNSLGPYAADLSLATRRGDVQHVERTVAVVCWDDGDVHHVSAENLRTIPA